MPTDPTLVPRQFELHELGNTYAGANDRFIVSLIVGYADGEGAWCGDPGVVTPRDAVAAAVALTQDEGSPDTNWYVYDRKTSTLHLFEQHVAQEGPR